MMKGEKVKRGRGEREKTKTLRRFAVYPFTHFPFSPVVK